MTMHKALHPRDDVDTLYVSSVTAKLLKSQNGNLFFRPCEDGRSGT